MFGNNNDEEIKELEDRIEELEEELEESQDEVKELRRDLKIAQKDHDIELVREQKKHEFELEHFKDEEIETVRKQNTELTKKLAVTENENKMLGKIVDVNKDIVDVKKLVETLIEKLPTVNISSIMAAPSKK